MKRETLPARRAWPRTSLEMDRTLPLISFFENPYSVGSISAQIPPGKQLYSGGFSPKK